MRLIPKAMIIEGYDNNFVWENIGSSLNFTKGKHSIMLDNVAGCAVCTSLIANKTKNIYLLEAESDFYIGKGRSTNHPSSSSNYPLFEYEGKDIFGKTLKSQFRIPVDADLMSL